MRVAKIARIQIIFILSLIKEGELNKRIFLFLCSIIKGEKKYKYHREYRRRNTNKVAKIPRIFFFPFQREREREEEGIRIYSIVEKGGDRRGSSLSSLESRESFAELRYRSFRPFLSFPCYPAANKYKDIEFMNFHRGGGGGTHRRSSRGWRAAAATFNKAIANLVGSIKQEREEKSDPL